jgi:hypothetical protein
MNNPDFFFQFSSFRLQNDVANTRVAVKSESTVLEI